MLCCDSLAIACRASYSRYSTLELIFILAMAKGYQDMRHGFGRSLIKGDVINGDGAHESSPRQLRIYQAARNPKSLDDVLSEIV